MEWCLPLCDRFYPLRVPCQTWPWPSFPSRSLTFTRDARSYNSYFVRWITNISKQNCFGGLQRSHVLFRMLAHIVAAVITEAHNHESKRSLSQAHTHIHAQTHEVETLQRRSRSAHFSLILSTTNWGLWTTPEKKTWRRNPGHYKFNP